MRLAVDVCEVDGVDKLLVHKTEMPTRAETTELRDAADEVAERIRSLGHFAPGSYKQYAKLTSIDEAEGVPSAEEMVRQLESRP